MTTKECSSCKTANPISASFCRKCGHRFPEHTKPRKSHMCHIENFSIKKQPNGKFLVEWIAVNADKVILNGRDVTGKNKFIATVNGSQTISLRAENETSFDVKEANVVFDSQTIYKDKIVERKVTSGTNVFAIVFLVLFFLLSSLLIHYAYQLENRNYSGDRYLSNIFGYKPYLLVNGSNEGRKVNVPAQGASLMYDVKTNASEYEVLDLPNWCTLEKNGSHFIIKAPKNSQSDRTANISIKTKGDEVTMRLEQSSYRPQRLLVNDKKVVDSNLSAASGQITYMVATDADSYEVTSLSPWFKVIAQGSESFTIFYEENPKRTERTDWFKVKAEGMEVKINLTQAAQKITGEIKDITVEHNVFKDGVKGMKILVDFSVQNMKGIDGSCAVYFYYKDGRTVKDKNQRYYTAAGDAATHTAIKPGHHPSTLYTDLEIFMPYNELEVGTGKHELKFYCQIWENSSTSAKSVVQSQYYSFTLTNN